MDEYKAKVAMCWDCAYCGPPYAKRRVNGKERITRICKKHGIEVGESAVTCDCGTNKIPMFGWMAPVRSEDGWEDY